MEVNGGDAVPKGKPKCLIFDSRYGWVYDEWTDPVDVAYIGGRGRFALVPLVTSVIDRASALAITGVDAACRIAGGAPPPPPSVQNFVGAVLKGGERLSNLPAWRLPAIAPGGSAKVAETPEASAPPPPEVTVAPLKSTSKASRKSKQSRRSSLQSQGAEPLAASSPESSDRPAAAEPESSPVGPVEVKMRSITVSMRSANGQRRESKKVKEIDPPRRAKLKQHVVQKKETVFSISRQYNVSMEEIMAANGMKDPLELKFGATLTIP